MSSRRAEPTLIERALGEPAGQTCLVRARDRLLDDLRRNRFSSARAARIYASSIDDAVWAYVGRFPLGRIIYHDHLMRDERSQRGNQLAAAFVRETGAVEHRSHRRWFAWRTPAPQ